MKTDPELVQQSLQGNEGAFCELVDRYRARIYTFVLRIVKNPEDAGDVSQEVFVRVYRSLKSYDQSRKFSSWLFKIAQNMAIDNLRTRRSDTFSLDEPVETEQGEFSYQLPSREIEPDSALESTEVAEALDVAIADLEPGYRSVIMLRHVEGKSYEEIAEIMELPLGTVKTYIYRARRMLRAHLKNLLPGHEI